MAIRFRGLFFIISLLFTIPTNGQAIVQPTLSPQAEISLITCAPGSALFEAFGHSAIRVNDPVSGFDMAYNYGVFDFDQPNFYLNFAKGYLLYKLGTAEFDRFLYQYMYFDRTVEEQILDLTHDQKNAVFKFLQLNSLPENREYYYDYFFDNCATRPRDVFIEILGDSLRFDYGYADTLDYTIRGLIDRYIEDKDQFAWGDLGIDLGLGANIDRLATPFEYMYQPEFLYLAFEGATLAQADGSISPLVNQTKTLYQGAPQSDQISTTFTPSFVFWTLLVLLAIASAFELWKQKYQLLAFDFLFFAFLGLYGLLLVFLWFFTNHTAATHNWNMLWGWPTHVIAAFLVLIRKPPKLLKFYFILTALLTSFLLFFWAWLPQDLHDSLIPFLILIVMRSLVVIKLKLMPNKATPVQA
ncbi:hypothetical protein OKW21_002647 [Catalinimonas alkaloidigena]|uniref:lipoprotein N-acyltransferase Lnb domain-containing protein n=1 Tax=Catalinimonas alkaloidigena TaxID=1075417 RepID=UPI0024070BA7|nr:DUF4105 domain-containing protein [Catalinimonas alkaloidigena]MDF9797384.1 hypothetical protein [Catalinimonas alkaloidigena]